VRDKSRQGRKSLGFILAVSFAHAGFGLGESCKGALVVQVWNTPVQHRLIP